MKRIIFILFPVIAFGQQVPVAQNPESLKLKRLDVINSPYRETNLSITPDGRLLYFMSLRGGNPWSDPEYSMFRGQWRYDGDIWFSRKIDGEWQPPECLPNTVNTAVAEDEPNVSPDGNYVLYQSWRDGWYVDGGPYWISELIGDVWGKPEGVSGGINQFFKIEFRKHEGYATDGAALSPDGNRFIVAVAPDYDDSMDVYMSVKDEEGIWNYLEDTNLSTPGDERSVFIAGDGKTIYFASDGYNGFGGLDIFKATLTDDETFTDIINIGEPFNSPADDYSFIVTASGNEAYFVRDGNIYYCDLTPASPEIKPLPAVLIKGLVQDIYGNPLESNIKLKKMETNEIKATAKSNSKTGNYSLSFYKEKGNYEQEIESEGYRKITRQFTLDNSVSYEEILFDTMMIETDMVLVHFDFDEYEIRDGDREVLDSLARLLYRNRSLRLMIGGHTDEKGTIDYNDDLSKLRVEAVSGYFRSKGIPRKIMKLDHYGETRPKATRDIPNYDAINRRVEIKIIDLQNMKNSGQ